MPDQVEPGRRRGAYWTAATMYSTAARTSASLSLGLPPRGGMARMPLIEWATRVSIPAATRALQPALSPNFGAPATPELWQTPQVAS